MIHSEPACLRCCLPLAASLLTTPIAHSHRIASIPPPTAHNESNPLPTFPYNDSVGYLRLNPTMASQAQAQQRPKVQPCRYKTGKTLGAGSYSVVKECVHIDTGHYYAAKVINKRLMAGREHMVGTCLCLDLWLCSSGAERESGWID